MADSTDKVGEGMEFLTYPKKQGAPINAYKQFKAIDKHGNTYYMSGVRRGY